MSMKLDNLKWFRGFSEVQYEACNNLFNALRDDVEQGSWYRTRVCLHNLGVEPLPSVSLLRQIIKVSQGSDLAFLFFLWEGYYKSNCGNEYTLNEQLLLSAITHLDMMSTMRELDRILPPSSHSKKARLRQRKKELAAQPATPKPQPKKLDMNILPYFYKLVRPIEHRTKMRSTPKDLHIIFPQYENYANKRYTIPNEQNRWFEHYVPQPSRRIIKNVIADTFDVIFLNFDRQDLTDKTNYCFAHRKYRKQMFAKAAEMKHKVLQKCLDFSDLAGTEAKKRRDRIVSQLERAINNCHAQLKQYAQRQFPEVVTLKGKRSSCELCKQVFSVPPKYHNPDFTLLMGLDQRTDVTTQFETHDTVRVQILKDNVKTNRFSEFEEFTNLVCVEPRMDELPIPSPCRPKPVEVVTAKTDVAFKPIEKKLKGKDKKGRAKKSIVPPKPARPKIPSNQPILKPICTEKELRRESMRRPQASVFFQANSTNNPYQFDYQTIFDLDVTAEGQMGALPCEQKQKSITAEKVVQKCLIDALNSEPTEDCNDFCESKERLDGGACAQSGKCCLSTKEEIDNCPRANSMVMSESIKREEIDEAIKICVQRMLRPKANESAHDDRRLAFILANPCGETFGLDKYFQLPYIDPDDTELMTTMLRHAMQELRVNPKFVLASMPNAYQIPVLQDWIAARYHKTYTITELEDAFNESMEQYERRARAMQRSEPEPDFKKYLIDPEAAQNEYFEILNKTTLEKTRLIYWAMRGYSIMHENTRNPFFAFQPSRAADIMRFRPWNDSDYRDYVFLRDFIQTRKQQE